MALKSETITWDGVLRSSIYGIETGLGTGMAVFVAAGADVWLGTREEVGARVGFGSGVAESARVGLGTKVAEGARVGTGTKVSVAGGRGSVETGVLAGG